MSSRRSIYPSQSEDITEGNGSQGLITMDPEGQGSEPGKVRIGKGIYSGGKGQDTDA